LQPSGSDPIEVWPPPTSHEDREQIRPSVCHTMNTMEALQRPPPSGHPAPSAALSETTTASPGVAIGGPASPPRPAPPPLGPLQTSLQTHDQTDAFPPLPSVPASHHHSLPSPRSGRSQSLAIKRKPLSSTASPIATRYSTRDYLDPVKRFPRPEQRFSRSCSLDSPTLYEFPDRQTLVATGLLLSSHGSTASVEPSQPYVTMPLSTLSHFAPHFAWLK
jgi:hypothetical protein